MDRLDPALTRPGRMGRHVWFRTPTKDDRKDIFDLYLDKVSHDPELDSPERRDEIARITNGYSPAMIEQICSMALTNAHHEGAARVRLEPPRRRDDGGRVGHGGRRPLRRARDARGRDPRGGARRRRARVPARPRVEPHLDQDARRLARPSPGVREGGALQRVAERAVRRARPRPRRDGRGDRLLRRELGRRRRRPPVGDVDRLDDGRRLRHGADADQAERQPAGRRDRGGDARAHREALREARRPAAEPHAGRRLRPESDRRDPQRPGEAAARGPVHRAGVRHRRLLRQREQGRGRAHRERGDREAGDLRRRARSACSTRRISRSPRSTGRRKSHGHRSDERHRDRPRAPRRQLLQLRPRARRGRRTGSASSSSTACSAGSSRWRSRASSSSRAGRSARRHRGRRGIRAAAASARRSRSPTTSARRTASPTAASSST